MAVVTLAICVIVGAGIGVATATTAAPAACELLTPQDVQTVLGGKVGAGDLNIAPDGGESICTWTVITSASGSGYSAQLDVKAPFTTKEFAQQRRIASGATKTVQHLGDASFSERAKLKGQVYDDLWVRAGAVAFRLEVLKDLGPKPLERLAAVVLTNLAKPGG
jgi:hypothetical protein